MKPLQKQRCLAAMNELQRYAISRMFAHPVDPVRDNCPDYFHVIPVPMDLGTARRKLELNQYHTVEQWKSDIDLIWMNTVNFNGGKSLLSILAKQCQQHFREITATLSSDFEADWTSKFEKLKGEVNQLIKFPPKISLASRFPRRIVPARSCSMISGVKPEEKSVKLGVPVAFPGPVEMTGDDIARLAVDVNLIEDSDGVDQIIALVDRMEPDKELSAADDEIELDVSKLEQATLVELRLLVNKLLGR
jgi:hypothetical protein